MHAGSGIMTCTVANHGMVTGNRVQFARGSIRFRCMMDQRKTIKDYPRRKDPQIRIKLSVTTVDLDKFSVNVEHLLLFIIVLQVVHLILSLD